MTTSGDRPALDAATLRDGLAGPGLPWRALDVVGETGSTNADLLARAAAGEDIDRVVLLAEHQTAGRGRLGRHWLAPPGAQLALSVGVNATDVPASAWGWLPLATGVAVADALAGVAGIEAGLKWPNDVVVGDRKLAGILAEVAKPRQAPKKVVVVGLGLNVTMTAGELPDEIRDSATSLAILGASVTDRNVLADKVLRELATRIEAWRATGGADDALVADYQRYSRTLDTRVRADLPGDRTLAGLATTVDELGRLCIDTGSGVETVSAGDVTHLRPGA